MNRFSATLTVVILCVGAVFAVRAWKPDLEELEKKRTAERSLGSEKAPLWITEYFDYQCPPCANARKILEQAIADHPGQVYLQVRFYPMPAHKNAMKAALYAECASRQKGKFWGFHEELFKNQAQWAMDNYPELMFSSYAEKAGLRAKQLDACVADPKALEAVKQEKEKAATLGVNVTPSFFINGKMAVGTGGLKSELDAYFGAKDV